MSAWWRQLQPRQRGLILVAGVVALAAIVYVGLWEPLAESRAAERDRIAQQRATLSWLEAVTPLAREMRSNDRRGRGSSERSLLGLADESARAAGLAGALERIEPSGSGEVRIWLEGAGFVDTMQWLVTLAREQPIRVGQVQMDRAGREGRVNVRITLVADA